MSFMMFPPEINSALMYAGAGSGPLMAAASAWDELAADLETTANSYQAMIQQLTGGPWLGPSSVQMASATAPYIAWLQGSSIQAAQTSAQARLAAAAYEGAFDATVPPSVIAANRALLAALVATNFLGQNIPGDRGHRSALHGDVVPGRADDGHLCAGFPAGHRIAASRARRRRPATGGRRPTRPRPPSRRRMPASRRHRSAGAAQGLPGEPRAAANGIRNWTAVLAISAYRRLYRPGSQSSLGTTATTGVTSAAGSILPVQAVYYVTMFASMPAKMLMSMANSMNASPGDAGGPTGGAGQRIPPSSTAR